MKKKTFFWRKELQPLLLIVLIVIASFAVNILVLSKYPLVLGRDGGYYVSRTESFLKTGSTGDPFLHSPPFFFAVSAFFASFFETNLAINIAASLFCSLIAVSVFLLARLLLKNSWLALAAALFAVFSRVPIIFLSDFKKSLAGAFLIPLFFFFLLRSGSSKKNLAAALAILALSLLAYKLAFGIELVVLLCFVAMRLGFERRPSVEANKALFVFGIAAVAFAIFFVVNSNAALAVLNEGANWANNISNNGNLEEVIGFFSLLWPAALFGALVCIVRPTRERLFLLAWFLVALYLAMLFVSGQESSRLQMMLFLPVVLLSALSIGIVFKRFGYYAALGLFVLLFAVSLQSFVFYAQNMIQPTVTQQDLSDLASFKPLVGDNCYLFPGATFAYWAEYALKCPMEIDTSIQSVFQKAKQKSLEGQNAFIIVNTSKGDEKFFSKEFFEEAARSGKFVLLKPIVSASAPEQKQETTQPKYNTERLSNPLVYLFFPTELVAMLGLFPFSFLVRTVVALPLTFAVFGFAIFLLSKKIIAKK